MSRSAARCISTWTRAASRITASATGSAVSTEQYGPVHDVIVEPGGVLDSLVKTERFKVNSLHSQGIDRLAPPLRKEATAPDGAIEAVSMAEPKGFLLGRAVASRMAALGGPGQQGDVRGLRRRGQRAREDSARAVRVSSAYGLFPDTKRVELEGLRSAPYPDIRGSVIPSPAPSPAQHMREVGRRN